MRLRLTLSLGVSLICCVACSTRQSSTAHRLWHQFTLQYNALYNAEEALRNTRTEQLSLDSTPYRLALPLDIYSEEYAEPYQRTTSKLERAILAHSLRQKPPKKQQLYKEQIEFNRRMYRAWLLLGEAQFYSGSLEQAEQTFAHIRWLYRGEPSVYNTALLWQCRTLVALGRSSDADILMLDLGSYEASLKGKARKLHHWFRAEYALSIGSYAQAAELLLTLARSESKPPLKARLYYALALVQAYGLEHEEAGKSYLRKALSYLLEPTAQQRLRDAYAQSRGLAVQLPGRVEGLNDTLPQPKQDFAVHSSDSTRIPYPIDWLRIYEQDSSQAVGTPSPNIKPTEAKSLYLSVQASDIALGEYLFLLSSYHFKHFIQLPLRIELRSSASDSVYQVHITGFRHSKDIEAYTSGLRSALPLDLAISLQ